MSRSALAVVAGLLVAPCAFAQAPPNPFNPQPLPDDLVLPVPGGGGMAFRTIEVAGREFWGNAGRSIRLGRQGAPEADGSDVFESPVRTMAAGSFPGPNGQSWIYHIGKYEVSKAQFVAVMGKGDQAAGLRALAEASNDPEDARLPAMDTAARGRELARPVAWIGWSAVQRFIDGYNLWCFADSGCLGKLPRLDETPGFFRLPTEIEWEYAARGGLGALLEKPNAEAFGARVPFPANRWEEFAVVGSKANGATRRIGSVNAAYGLHDMLGNVQELVVGLFQPELGQGKSGALVARGGSYMTSERALRTSMRAEVEIYRWDGQRMEEQRTPTTGFRLAIGSLVVPTQKFRRDVVAAYPVYQGTLQTLTPLGTAQHLPAAQAMGSLGDAEKTLADIARAFPATAQQVERVTNYLVETRAKLQAEIEMNCQGYARQALYAAREFGNRIYNASSRQALLEKYELLSNPSASSQQNIILLRREVPRMNDEADYEFGRYSQNLLSLRQCGPDERAKGFEVLRQRARGAVDRAALALVEKHSAAPEDQGQWRRDLAERVGIASFWTR